MDPAFMAGSHAEIQGPTLKMEFPHIRFSTLNTAILQTRNIQMCKK